MVTARIVSRNRYGASTKLGDRISSYLTGPSRAQLDLSQELAVIRTVLGDVLECYGAIDELPNKEAIPLARLNFQERITSAVDAVARTAKAWAEVEAKLTIEPAMVASLANSLQLVLTSTLPPELLETVESQLSSVFANLDASASRQVILNPADTIKALDAAIPATGLAMEAKTSADTESDDEEPEQFKGTTAELIAASRPAYQQPNSEWTT